MNFNDVRVREIPIGGPPIKVWVGQTLGVAHLEQKMTTL